MCVYTAPLLALVVLVGWTPAVAAPREDAARAPVATVSPPTVDEVTRLLRSERPQSIAWGAYKAGEAGMRQVGPWVLERLGSCTRALLGRAARQVRANLLDAAIQLGLMPSADVLVRLARGHAEAVATLVAGAPDAPPATLLAVFDVFDAGGFEIEPWLALGNGLRARHAPGFSARLLRRYALHRRVQVWSKKGPYGRWRGASGSVVGCGWVPVLPGYPPLPRYRLDCERRPHYELLADGACPVYVTRWEVRRGRVWFCSVSPRHTRKQDCRREWLAQLASGTPGVADARSVPIDTSSVPAYEGVIDLRYTGRQPWNRALRRAAGRLGASYGDLLTRLVDRGCVTKSEVRNLRPVIEFEVVDKRGDKRHALPPVPVLIIEGPWSPPKRTPRHPPRCV